MIRRRLVGILTAFIIVETFAGCSGPGGVDLGKDWAGSDTFVLSKMSGLTTVVGINSSAHHAQPLVAVPSQSDDEDTLAPSLTHLVDGSWLITVYRKNDRPSRVYRIDRRDHSVEVLGEIEEKRNLEPDGKGVAAIGGSDTGPATALRYRVGSWHVNGDVPLGGPSQLASGGSRGSCIAFDKGSDTVLEGLAADSNTTVRQRVPGVSSQALDCSGAVSALGGTRTDEKSAASGSPTSAMPIYRTVSGVDVLTVSGGASIGRVLSVPHGVLVAVHTPAGCRLFDFTRSSHTLRTQTKLPGLAVVDGLVPTPKGYVAYGNDTAVTINAGLTATTAFDLPAQVEAAP